MRQTIPLTWTETQSPAGNTDRRPQIPVPDGDYLAWASVNEETGTVTYETAPVPPPPPPPDPPADPPAP